MDQESENIVRKFVDQDWVKSYYNFYNKALDKKTESLWRHNDVSAMIEKEIYYTKIAINVGKLGILFSVFSFFLFSTIIIAIIVFSVSFVLVYESKKSLVEAEKRKEKFKGKEEDKLKKRPIDKQIVLDFFLMKFMVELEKATKGLVERQNFLKIEYEKDLDDDDLKLQVHYCDCSTVVMLDVAENMENSISNLKKQVFSGGDTSKEDAMVKSLLRYVKNLEEHIVEQLL
ncbi:hypothetical protein MJH12_03125 [bacterium]|nr:hypothetical protein [bacterium]